MKRLILLLIAAATFLGCKNEYTEALKREIQIIDNDIDLIENYRTKRYLEKMDSIQHLMDIDSENFFIHYSSYQFWSEKYDVAQAEINELEDKKKEYQLQIKKHTRFFDKKEKKTYKVIEAEPLP